MNKTNVKEIYLNINRIKTSEGDLVVSPKHKVYVKEDHIISNSLAVINLITPPLNSSGEYCAKTLDITSFCDSKSLAGTLNSQIPKCFEEINLSSVKCMSRVINNLCSDKASLNTSPFSAPLGQNLTSCPSLVRNGNNPPCTFSSNKNFILGRNGDYEASFSKLSSEVQSSLNMFFSQGVVCFNDFFSSSPIFKHFQNYRDHNSCSFKSRLSMTDIAINDNILVNFDSHREKNDKEIFKSFALKTVTETYKDFNSGKEIYFVNALNKPIRVVSITKEPYSGKIYDVDVENDIVLVRRKNSSAIWSGNSNNGTFYGDATINLTVPSAEPPGDKNSTILFTAYYIEVT